MYCIAADLLFLALKAYRNGDIEGSAKMFASAAASNDVEAVERVLSEHNATGFDPSVLNQSLTLSAVDDSFLAGLESVDPAEIKNAIKRYRGLLHSHKPQAEAAVEAMTELTSGDSRDETLDMSDDDDPEIEVDDSELPEEYQPVSDTEEVEISAATKMIEEAGIKEGIKNALRIMKNRAQDWQVMNMIPIIIQMLPELFLNEKGGVRTDVKLDAKRVNAIINIILLHIDEMNEKKRQALYQVTRNAVTAFVEE